MAWQKKGMRFPLDLPADYYTIRRAGEPDMLITKSMQIIRGLPVTRGLVAWYEQDAVETRELEGNKYVTRMLDLSGNGYHALQATEVRQPLWSPQGIVFDGAGQRLISPDIPMVQGDNFTALVVADPLDYSSTTGSVVSIASAYSDSGYHNFNFTTNSAGYIRYLSTSTLTGYNGKFPIMGGLRRIGSSVEVFEPSNFAKVTVASVAGAEASIARLGFGTAARTNLTLNTKTRLSAVLVYKSVLTDEEITQVYQYIKWLLASKGVNVL